MSPRVSLALSLSFALSQGAGCSRSTAPTQPAQSEERRPSARASAAAPSAPLAPVPPLPATRQPAAPRVIAIGDVHGDINAMRAALRLAGAIDQNNHWSGGALVVVQTGDLLDRGDDERAILEWVPVLTEEARRAGGAYHSLNGNHELMNAQGDFRYVTPGGYEDFRGHEGPLRDHPALQRFPENARSRAAAFAPGGLYARTLAAMNTVLVVGDTAFVHGGLLPDHGVFGLEPINRAMRAFYLGERRDLPTVLEREDSPLWFRGYAVRDDEETCALLTRALEAAQVRRLVIGHTVQERGITSACNNRVWRIDVGLARHYGGPTQVLEITGENARPLGAGANASNAVRPAARSAVGEEALSETTREHTHEHAPGHDCASERPLPREQRDVWSSAVSSPAG